MLASATYPDSGQGQVIIGSLDELNTFARDAVQHHTHILLAGGMGSGKTTFTQFFCQHLLPPLRAQIQSPTYTYCTLYDERVLHIDMRRIESVEHFHELSLLELIEQYPYVIIEWPKREDLYVHTVPRLRLQFDKISDTSRSLTYQTILPIQA